MGSVLNPGKVETMTVSEGMPAGILEGLSVLARRTRFLPVPDKGFDPLKADAKVLQHFGLPTLLSHPAGSEGHAFRRAFLSGPARDRPPSFAPAIANGQLDVGQLQARPNLAASAPWPAQKSSNWSGAYVAPRNGRSLVSVTGNWVVPAVAAPGGGAAAEYRSSTWIGLDGQMSYHNSTLPQIGTSQFWTVATGNATYATWYQWWERGRHVPPQPLALPARPGDEISAIVTVLDPVTVRFNIKNVTLGLILQAFDVSAPAGCTISGGTAEWIMERPSELGSDGWNPYRLPAYQPFSFTRCLAEAKASGEATATPIGLESARLIRMYEIAGSPGFVRTISSARKVLAPQQKLDLTYVGP